MRQNRRTARATHLPDQLADRRSLRRQVRDIREINQHILPLHGRDFHRPENPQFRKRRA